MKHTLAFWGMKSVGWIWHWKMVAARRWRLKMAAALHWEVALGSGWRFQRWHWAAAAAEEHSTMASASALSKPRACHKPPSYVPYKCTYVPYDGTFGTSDQVQMLDVWQGEDSQIHHLIQQIRRFTISSVRNKSNQKRYRRIRFSTMILDHTDKK